MTSLLLALTAVLLSPPPPQERPQDTATGPGRGGRMQKVRRENLEIFSNGSRLLYTFFATPIGLAKPPAILIVHDDLGLSEWITRVCIELAEEGHIVMAPDLLTHLAPGGGRSRSFKSDADRRKAISKLTRVQIDSDLEAAADHLWRLPGSQRKVAIAGFGWGGGEAWRFPTVFKQIVCSFVFYGSPPKKQPIIAELECPVYGFYGGADKLTAKLPSMKGRMSRSKKLFFPEVYAEAEAKFFPIGRQYNAKGPNKEAANKAWKKWLDVLKARGKAPLRED